MTTHSNFSNRRIKMGKEGNYNESVGRDYIQGDVHYHINTPQDKNTSELQQDNSLDNESNLFVNSSGSWVLIKDYFFKSTKIKTHQDNTITVKIHSESAEEDANIRSLRPNRYGNSEIIAFAYRNDGCLVRVESIEEEFEAGICTYSLTLITEFQDSTGYAYNLASGSYSDSDIAELRGIRILLNNPPKPVKANHSFRSSDESTVEHLINKTNQDNISVEHGILKKLYIEYKDTPRKYLELSRLLAIFNLKATNVVEQVSELSLELIESDRVYVKFRGRRKAESYQEPIIIEIEGDCLLG